MKSSNKIKVARIKKGFTQKELANTVGTTQTTITNLENNITKYPSVDLAIKIADALNIDIYELFGEKGNQKKEEINKEIIEKVLSSIEIAIDWYLNLQKMDIDLGKEQEKQKFIELSLSFEEFKSQLHGVLSTFGLCSFDDIVNFYNEYPNYKKKERERMQKIVSD